MPYYIMLNRAVSSTNYTQEEIANKCTELGTKITRTYINKLLNNKLSAPTEEVSRAIAKVCNVDERLLVIEGYLDKAPKEIRDFIISLKSIIGLCSINFFENKVDKNSLNVLKNKLEEETLADFVIEMLKDNNNTQINDNGMFEIKTENGNIILNLAKPLSLHVKDNSMYPLIKENDKVILESQSNYSNGDVLAITLVDKKEIVIRQVVYLGKDVQLIPLNKEYKIEFYNKNNISILGKVKKVITEI